MLRRLNPRCPNKMTKSLGYCIPNVSKQLQTLLFSSNCFSGIRKAPMKLLSRVWKNRASLVSIVADGDHVFELPVRHLINRLRSLTGDVHRYFGHHLNSH